MPGSLCITRRLVILAYNFLILGNPLHDFLELNDSSLTLNFIIFNFFMICNSQISKINSPRNFYHHESFVAEPGYWGLCKCPSWQASVFCLFLYSTLQCFSASLGYDQSLMDSSLWDFYLFYMIFPTKVGLTFL